MENIKFNEKEFFCVRNVLTGEIKFFASEAGLRIFLKNNEEWRIK